MAKKCERCGAGTIGYNLLDYCASCSRDLCPKCMEVGCCGQIPAKSGEELDAAIMADNGRNTGGKSYR